MGPHAILSLLPFFFQPFSVLPLPPSTPPPLAHLLHSGGGSGTMRGSSDSWVAIKGRWPASPKDASSSLLRRRHGKLGGIDHGSGASFPHHRASAMDELNRIGYHGDASRVALAGGGQIPRPPMHPDPVFLLPLAASTSLLSFPLGSSSLG